MNFPKARRATVAAPNNNSDKKGPIGRPADYSAGEGKPYNHSHKPKHWMVQTVDDFPATQKCGHAGNERMKLPKGCWRTDEVIPRPRER